MNALILSLLMANSAPGAIPAKHLATAIMKEARYFNEDPLMLTKLILIESKGLSMAYNAKTQDFGILQINIKTAASLHLDSACLLDWKCNLHMGTSIWHNLHKYQDFRPCMYNTGYKGAKKYPKTCQQYEQRLAQYD